MPRNYQPFFCEENVWWLIKEKGPADELFVAFISNDGRACEMWSQKPAPEGAAVVWDYHVVAVERGPQPRVWDLDSRVPPPALAAAWLGASFRPGVPAPFAPEFRVVPSADFVRFFASDRRHMRDAEGGWQAPPPAWPPIVAPSGAVHTLDAFLDLRAVDIPGVVLDLRGFERWLRGE